MTCRAKFNFPVIFLNTDPKNKLKRCYEIIMKIIIISIIKTIAFIRRENMLGYLSADIICSEKRTVFRERSSRKTVSFEEQIMSKDKYPSIFSQPN